MMVGSTDRGAEWSDPAQEGIRESGQPRHRRHVSNRALPPVLGRLLSGTFWLALRVPLQVLFSLWTTRLVLQAIGPKENGAYVFAWGFGFFQFLLEFGTARPCSGRSPTPGRGATARAWTARSPAG